MYLTKWPWVVYIKVHMESTCEFFLLTMLHISQRGKKNQTSEVKKNNFFFCAGENEDEKLNEVMYEAWRFNRDCKLLRDGLQGLSWDGQCCLLSLKSSMFFFHSLFRCELMCGE